jgi:hypothetical protein
MPIRMPTPDVIRKQIAEAAAYTGGAAADHYVSLLGPVELTSVGSEGSWRVSYYHGSAAETRVIESAIGDVQRANPLMRRQ